MHGASQHVTYLWSRGGELGLRQNSRSLDLLTGATVFPTRFGEVVLMEAAHMAASTHNFTAASLAAAAAPNAHAQVTKKGWLYKVKRGGMAATWQKRYFAIAGSSLYYAADPDVLQAEPKLFCELGGGGAQRVEVMLAPSAVRGQSHVFAVVIGAAASAATGSAPWDAGAGAGAGAAEAGAAAARQPEVLLLRADSVDEREAWAMAIIAARPQPPCRQIALAGLLSYHQLAESDKRGGGFAAVYRYETRAEPSGAPSLLAGPGRGGPPVARGLWTERCLNCVPMTHSLDDEGREQFAADAAGAAQGLVGAIESAIARFRSTLARSTL